MCSVADAADFSGLLSNLMLQVLQFQFLVFVSYAVNRILRRIFR
jgi:hypothetical protein